MRASSPAGITLVADNIDLSYHSFSDPIRILRSFDDFSNELVPKHTLEWIITSDHFKVGGTDT
jgi:hypothetical protein